MNGHDRDAAFALMAQDLDRCQHGRHEGDACVECPDGVSVGNFATGETIGHSLHGTYAYVMPPRGQRHDPEAWKRRKPTGE